jgi:hypothetical protein
VTTLHVHAEGADLVVTVRSVDEEGEPVPTEPLAIPSSADIEQVTDGVRVLGAVRVPEDAADDQAEIGTSADIGSDADADSDS